MDTHVFRIARRLELAKGDTAEKVEQELMQVLPRERWISFSHQVIHHGRQVCMARNPKCERVQSGAAVPFEGQDVEFVESGGVSGSASGVSGVSKRASQRVGELVNAKTVTGKIIQKSGKHFFAESEVVPFRLDPFDGGEPSRWPFGWNRV